MRIDLRSLSVLAEVAGCGRALSNHVRGMSHNLAVGLIADEPSARISAPLSGRQSRHRKPLDGAKKKNQDSPRLAALTVEVMKVSVGTVMQLLAMLDRLYELHGKSMISVGEMELWSSWARTSIRSLLPEQLSSSSICNGAGGSSCETT